MSRAAKSKIVVEAEGDDGIWSCLKDGFDKVPEAEKWIRENIGFGDSLRVVKISGIFTKKMLISKR